MTSRRLIAFGLIAVPATMTALLSMRYYFSSALIAGALLGVPGLWQIRMRRDKQVLVLVAIILIFAVKYRLQPLTTIGGSTLPFFSLSPLMEYSLAHAMAQGLLTFLTALLFFRREKGLPLYVPLLSANAMVLAGNIPTVGTGAGKPVYLWLSLAVAGLTAVYYMTFRTVSPNRPSRGGRLVSVATLALLMTALGGGALFSHVLYKHRNDIDMFLGRLTYRMRQGDSMGFSRTARLGSVAAMQAEGGKTVALRIFSDTPPGYLRGMAFDTFLGDLWDVRGETTQAEPVVPPGAAPPLQPGERALQLRESPSVQHDWRVLAIYPTGRTDRVAFAPLGTVYLYTREGGVTVDSEGTPVSSTISSDTSYRIAVPEEPAFLDMLDERQEQLTAVPENIDPRVRELANTITRECGSVREKIDAITRFFTSNFTYRFGIEIPEGEDSLTYFLVNRTPAHCEYFASGATLLLRLSGIPTRYVTGYLVGAKNTYGGYWIARNKDAHAWVEAYDPERGWVVVEATPPGGRPSPGTGWLRQVWDYLKFRVQALREALARGDLVGLLAAAGVFLRDLFVALLKSSWTWLALFLLGAGLLWRYRKRRTPRVALPISPQIRKCQAMLGRMDDHVAEKGYARAPNETLNCFADRLEQADLPRPAAWYHVYVAIRYQPAITQEALERLAEDLETATTESED